MAAQQVGKIQVGRYQLRVEIQAFPVGGFRGGQISAGDIEYPQLQLHTGHVRMLLLYLHIFLEQSLQLLRLLRVDLVQWHAGQGQGDLHPYRGDFVIDQGHQQLEALVQWYELQRAHGADTQ